MKLFRFLLQRKEDDKEYFSYTYAEDQEQAEENVKNHDGFYNSDGDVEIKDVWSEE